MYCAYTKNFVMFFYLVYLTFAILNKSVGNKKKCLKNIHNDKKKKKKLMQIKNIMYITFM